LSDVTETLQDLLERRLRELGQRRGRGESISLREAWQRLPEDAEGRRTPTYETFRRIRQGGHTNISDETAAALATMLDVPAEHVYAAARIPPRLGPFELPSRAEALNPGERAAVLGVVDAILGAKSKAARVDLAGSPRVDQDAASVPGLRRDEVAEIERLRRQAAVRKQAAARKQAAKKSGGQTGRREQNEQEDSGGAASGDAVEP
jgi:predicted DNA-binding protein